MFGFFRSALRCAALAAGCLAAQSAQAQYPVPYYPMPAAPMGYFPAPAYYQPVMYIPAGSSLQPRLMQNPTPFYPGLPGACPPALPTMPAADPCDPARDAARSLQATPSGIPLETCSPPTVLPDCEGGRCGKGAKGCGRSPWSMQALVGSQFHVGPDDYQYGSVNLRLGYLTDWLWFEKSIFRGQLEPLLDVTGGLNYASDFGNFLVGPSLLLRYNFTKADRLQPYVQAGFGGLYNDTYRDNQNHLGQPVVMLGQAGVGTHYFFAPNWSFDLEGQYNHMSNFSGGSSRNLGIDAFGAAGGLTYYFGSRQ